MGALLLVALMCFWGCFLYKRFGKNDKKGLVKDVGGGTVIYNFMVYIELSICSLLLIMAILLYSFKVLVSL